MRNKYDMILVINRAPGLKLVVHTLLSSLKPIGQIVFMCCAFFIIFGILGVQLFRGKFFYCDGPHARHVTTRKQCEELNGHLWRNQQYNFDNLFQVNINLERSFLGNILLNKGTSGTFRPCIERWLGSDHVSWNRCRRCRCPANTKLQRSKGNILRLFSFARWLSSP